MSSTKLSRRRFLQDVSVAAGAISAPMIVPSSVFGANAPGNRITLAAIGAGARGTNHCWNGFAAQGQDDVRFVAAVDCFRSRRERFAQLANEKYGDGVCTPYADYREVLQRDDIDGVVISTPDHWHVPIAFRAALAGKDMYVEKPLGVALQWALKLRKVCADNDIVFQYGTQQRSMAMCRLGVDLVRNGFVGEINRVEVWSPRLDNPHWGSTEAQPVPEGLDYDRWIGPAPMKPYNNDRVSPPGSWHIYDYALGFIAGWGSHPLDILQWGLNTDHTSPVHYEGVGQLAAPEALADTLVSWDVHCRYADGLPLRFMSADVARPVVEQYHPAWRADGTTFFGDDGWVSISRGACYMNQKGRQVNVSHVKLAEDQRKAYVSESQLRNFVDCIRSRKPTINPLESAIRSDTISHLADVAIRTQRALQWDPDREVIVNDTEAANMLNRPMREPYQIPD